MKPAPQNHDNDRKVATVLYNGMIHPLVPYGVKGAIWYQGESNAARAYQYRALLPAMIGDWRNQWGEGDFPFYIVQLANWGPVVDHPQESEWAELREAQTMTATNVQNAGEALAIDIGDAANIHPKDKQDVGRRLALTALAKTYGQKIEYSGPEYKSFKLEGSRVRVSFNHLAGGLVVSADTPLSDYLTREGRLHACRRPKSNGRRQSLRHSRRRSQVAPGRRRARRRRGSPFLLQRRPPRRGALCLGEQPGHQPLQQSRPPRRPVPHGRLARPYLRRICFELVRVLSNQRRILSTVLS